MIKADEMRRIFLREGTYIIPPVRNQYVRAIENQMQIMREMTRYIPFNCDFDEAGDCLQNRNRNDRGHNIKADKRCCCSGCMTSAGYLRNVFDWNINMYAAHFDPKTGFWRKGKGCNLERKYRSSICLTYRCTELRDFWDEKDDSENNIITRDLMMVRDTLEALERKANKTAQAFL